MRRTRSHDDDGWSRRHALAALGIPLALDLRPLDLVGGRSIDEVDGAGRGGTLSVAQFGAVGDGRTDDTGAFQRAVDRLSEAGGGVLTLPPGVFRTGTVHFPLEPATVRTMGAGPTRTVWEMLRPDKPVIAIDPRRKPGRSLGAVFADFTIRAHPDGDPGDNAQIAVDATGFNDVTFRNLRFLSNGRGSVGTWFRTASHPHPSYQQRFIDLVCQGNRGPGHVIRAENAGDALTNTNLIFVDGFWIYANREMRTAFDLSRSTVFSIRRGLIESSGAWGVHLGNTGVVENVWFEDLSAGPVRFSVGAGAAGSSNNVLRSLYFSGFSGIVQIPRDCANNLLQNVGGGAFRVRRADPLGGNVVVNAQGRGRPPAVAQFAGARGDLRVVEAFRASAVDEHWRILCRFEPPASGTYGLRVTAPDGAFVTKLYATAAGAADGVPRSCAVSWPVTDLFLSAPDDAPMLVILQLSME